MHFWLLPGGFSSVPGPNLTAVSSVKSSRSTHSLTKLNHTNNTTNDNFILNVQILIHNALDHQNIIIMFTSAGKISPHGSVARTDC